MNAFCEIRATSTAYHKLVMTLQMIKPYLKAKSCLGSIVEWKRPKVGSIFLVEKSGTNILNFANKGTVKGHCGEESSWTPLTAGAVMPLALLTGVSYSPIVLLIYDPPPNSCSTSAGSFIMAHDYVRHSGWKSLVWGNKMQRWFWNCTTIILC